MVDLVDRINGVLSSLAIKVPCKAIAVSNITLSGEQTVNSVAVVSGDRVLVIAQTSGVDNGIYDVSTAAWTRSPDFDGKRDAVYGTLVVVAASPVVGFYQLTTANPITIGTTALTFIISVDVSLAANLALTSNGQGASLIGIEDAAGNLTATDVEAAIAEMYVDFLQSFDVVDDLSPQLGGALDCNSNPINMGDQILDQPLIQDYAVKHQTLVSSSAVLTINLELGQSVGVVLFEDITSIVINNWPAADLGALRLRFLQNGSGNWTVTGYPAATLWKGGGTEPVITTTADTGRDVILLESDDGGTIIDGFFGQDIQ